MKRPTSNTEMLTGQQENDRKKRSQEIKKTRVLFWMLVLTLFGVLTVGDLLSAYLHRHWAHAPSHFVISSVLVVVVVAVILGLELRGKWKRRGE